MGSRGRRWTLAVSGGPGSFLRRGPPRPGTGTARSRDSCASHDTDNQKHDRGRERERERTPPTRAHALRERERDAASLSLSSCTRKGYETTAARARAVRCTTRSRRQRTARTRGARRTSRGARRPLAAPRQETLGVKPRRVKPRRVFPSRRRALRSLRSPRCSTRPSASHCRICTANCCSRLRRGFPYVRASFRAHTLCPTRENKNLSFARTVNQRRIESRIVFRA